MTIEGTIDTIQSAAQQAASAVATVTSKEARGDIAGALAQIEVAENALRFALAGIAAARGALKAAA